MTPNPNSDHARLVAEALAYCDDGRLANGINNVAMLVGQLALALTQSTAALADSEAGAAALREALVIEQQCLKALRPFIRTSQLWSTVRGDEAIAEIDSALAATTAGQGVAEELAELRKVAMANADAAKMAEMERDTLKADLATALARLERAPFTELAEAETQLAKARLEAGDLAMLGAKLEADLAACRSSESEYRRLYEQEQHEKRAILEATALLAVDAQRLDWLDKTEHDLVYDPEVGAFSAWQVWSNSKFQNGRPLMVAFANSLREALDRAMGKTARAADTAGTTENI